MNRCKKCNKRIFNGFICSNCLRLCELNIRTMPLSQQTHLDLLNRDNMPTNYYVGIIDGFLIALKNMYDDLEYVPKYKEQIEPNNFKEVEILMRQKLKNRIEEIKQEKISWFNNTGEIKFLSVIIGLEEDIKDTIKEYPQYKRELNYDDLEEIIKRSGG